MFQNLALIVKLNWSKCIPVVEVTSSPSSGAGGNSEHMCNNSDVDIDPEVPQLEEKAEGMGLYVIIVKQLFLQQDLSYTSYEYLFAIFKLFLVFRSSTAIYASFKIQLISPFFCFIKLIGPWYKCFSAFSSLFISNNV